MLITLAWAGHLDAQDAPRIQLEPAAAVAPDALTSIRAVRELGDGRVLVSDRTERRLVLLDLDAGTVVQVGREGTGPGEYAVPGTLYPLAGDSTVVVDAASRRWLFVDGGQIVDTWAARRSPADQFNLEIQGLDGVGRVLALAFHSGTPPDGMPGLAAMPHHADSLAVVRIDGWRNGDPDPVVETLTVVAGPGTRSFCFTVTAADERVRRVGGCSPVSGQDMALPFADGWIAVAYHDPYRVAWRRPDGDWVRGPELPLSPRSLSEAEEQCFAVRRFPFRGVERPCGGDELVDRDWPSEVPPFLALATRQMAGPGIPPLLATPEGRLMVRRTPAPGVNQNHYDVWNRQGELDATLSLPANEAVLGFGPGSIYVIETGAFDLQTLRRHPWEHGSSAPEASGNGAGKGAKQPGG